MGNIKATPAQLSKANELYLNEAAPFTNQLAKIAALKPISGTLTKDGVFIMNEPPPTEAERNIHLIISSIKDKYLNDDFILSLPRN